MFSVDSIRFGGFPDTDPHFQDSLSQAQVSSMAGNERFIWWVRVISFLPYTHWGLLKNSTMGPKSPNEQSGSWWEVWKKKHILGHFYTFPNRDIPSEKIGQNIHPPESCFFVVNYQHWTGTCAFQPFLAPLDHWGGLWGPGGGLGGLQNPKMT